MHSAVERGMVNPYNAMGVDSLDISGENVQLGKEVKGKVAREW